MAAIPMSKAGAIMNEIADSVKNELNITNKRIMCVSVFGFVINGRNKESDLIADKIKSILFDRKIGFTEVSDSAGIDINVELEMNS